MVIILKVITEEEFEKFALVLIDDLPVTGGKLMVLKVSQLSIK